MKLIAVSVPLDAALPHRLGTLQLGVHAGTHVDRARHFFVQGAGVHPPPSFCRSARRASSSRSRAAASRRRIWLGGEHEMYCLPLVGSDDAPARVVLRRS